MIQREIFSLSNINIYRQSSGHVSCACLNWPQERHNNISLIHTHCYTTQQKTPAEPETSVYVVRCSMHNAYSAGNRDWVQLARLRKVRRSRWNTTSKPVESDYGHMEHACTWRCTRVCVGIKSKLRSNALCCKLTHTHMLLSTRQDRWAWIVLKCGSVDRVRD